VKTLAYEEQQSNREKYAGYDQGEDYFEADHCDLHSLSATSLE
jgi:hypothetical protein